MKKMFRQGDVIIMATTADAVTPEHREVPREAGRVVLAHGEVTGHSHAIRAQGVCLLVREGISDRVLTIGADIVALLEHEEHGTISLPPGTYTVRQQREWTGEDERVVQD
jgi:hypothetical protein